MNGTTNTKAFPRFAPGGYRREIANVHRWARQNGWTWSPAWGWMNATYHDDATLLVEWDESDVTVWRRNDRGVRRPESYRAEDAQMAIDLLVALLILPDQFATSYRQGWFAGIAATVPQGGAR